MVSRFSKLMIVFLLLSCRQEVSFSPTPDIPLDSSVPRPSEGGVDINPDPTDPDVEPPVVGPVIRLLQKPQDHYMGDKTLAEFEVIVGDHPLVNLECAVNNVPIVCQEGMNKVELKNLLVGSYNLSLFVQDSVGLMARVNSPWKVRRVYQSITNTRVIQANSNKADVLFVIDNSGSMQEEQTEIGNRINRFFEKLKILDWRVGIITTDPYEYNPVTNKLNPLSDGALLRFPNGQYHLNSNLSQTLARKYFEQTIYRPETGNGHERGLYNTYRSIERSQNPVNDTNKRLKEFYRNEASLSVVLISDEDETLLDGALNPLWSQEKSRGDELIKKVSQVWGEKKLFRFNSVIVRPGDQACIKTHEKFGYAYEQVSLATQGVVEDICASDYSGALQNIADQVLNLQKSFLLDCEPQDVDGDGQIEMEVRREGSGPIPAFIINKNQIEFARPLEYGRYNFKYFCL